MSERVHVVFIHGLWLHATSWQPWVELFRERGYEPVAPGWPGEPATVEEARANPDAVADRGIEDVADHFAEVVAGLGGRVVAIGHSFGGLIAENLLARDLVAAAVGIDPAPMKGTIPLPPAQLRAGSPVLKSPANKHRSVALTAEQFRYGFGNAIDEAQSAELFERWTIPSPGRPLFEAAFANFTRHSPAAIDTHAARGPLLLVTGGEDHTVPESVVRDNFKKYRHADAVTELVELPDRGHSLTIDAGWRELADTVLGWLDKNLADAPEAVADEA
jgi:pimeloyl-ACP methyl ester carboxylesterase